MLHRNIILSLFLVYILKLFNNIIILILVVCSKLFIPECYHLCCAYTEYILFLEHNKEVKKKAITDTPHCKNFFSGLLRKILNRLPLF